MKATFAKLLPVLLLTTSCGSGVFYVSRNVDDNYYVPADKQVVIDKRIDVASEPRQVAREENAMIQDTVRVAQRDYTLMDNTSQEYVDENYNGGGNYDNYNDYGDDYYYTSRINRFHRPYMGFNYYDPWYGGGFGYGGMGFGMGYGGYGMGYGYYDPFYSDFYSPWGYNSWYGGYYGMGYGMGYYGMGYSPWLYNDYFYGGWGDNHGDKKFYYGKRTGIRTDRTGSGRSGGREAGDQVYARGGGSQSGTGSSGNLKAAQTRSTIVTPRSSNEVKMATQNSGTPRSSISTRQDQAVRSSSNLQDRSNSSSYIRSRTGNSYVTPPAQGSSSLRSSSGTQTGNRSSYVRPKNSTSTGSSSGSALSGSSSGRSSSGYSSSGRSSSSTGRSSSGYTPSRSSSGYSSSGTTTRSSSGYSSGSSSRSSSSGFSSGSSSRSSSSGFSSGSSGRSSSSGSSGSSRSSGGGKR